MDFVVLLQAKEIQEVNGYGRGDRKLGRRRVSGQCMNRARNKEAELLSVAFLLVLRDSINSLQRGIKNRKQRARIHMTPPGTASCIIIIASADPTLRYRPYIYGNS